MKNQDYQEILKAIRGFRGLTRDCAMMLISTFKGHLPLALYSILSQEIQNKTKIAHRNLYSRDIDYYDTFSKAVMSGQPPGILLRMAVQLDTCPALLARKVLELCYKTENSTSVSKMMRDTTLIDHKDLALDVYLCILYDDQYGPLATAISESVGEEYESILENHLIQSGISFLDESHLRTRGFDKTPDCKLAIPVAVGDFVINWIESKAQFGSAEIHKKYTQEQFLSYWNRFGPGLVIYWFGFLDDLDQSSESKFIIMDHFPKNINRLDPNSLKISSCDA
ncbi:hypothetical protein QAD02_011473 [Eretmocerus hayati]|uniref:Uncharacterized protein n=1 Tax=Eretmocerus hayati TaxID=131215 RepID=A0ACC2NZR4_9HYME|nr:hypothetical protein QAD02_011473 [Eretmocerus hayati]